MKRIKEYLVYSLVAFVLWVFISQVVFGLRHPWITDTERMLHFVDAMAFSSVEYDDMRERK